MKKVQIEVRLPEGVTREEFEKFKENIASATLKLKNEKEEIELKLEDVEWL